MMYQPMFYSVSLIVLPFIFLPCPDLDMELGITLKILRELVSTSSFIKPSTLSNIVMAFILCTHTFFSSFSIPYHLLALLPLKCHRLISAVSRCVVTLGQAAVPQTHLALIFSSSLSDLSENMGCPLCTQLLF